MFAWANRRNEILLSPASRASKRAHAVPLGEQDRRLHVDSGVRSVATGSIHPASMENSSRWYREANITPHVVLDEHTSTFGGLIGGRPQGAGASPPITTPLHSAELTTAAGPPDRSSILC
jgi:hypothetical protein